MRYQIPRFRCRLVAEGVISSPREEILETPDAAVVLRELLCGLEREHLYVLHLNGASRLIGAECVAVGGPHACAATVSTLFRGALLAGAAAVVMGHNHPSGDPTPSSDDRQFTLAAGAAGKVLGIVVLDHLVVCPERGSFCRVPLGALESTSAQSFPDIVSEPPRAFLQRSLF